jgi:hypothetical protein
MGGPKCFSMAFTTCLIATASAPIGAQSVEILWEQLASIGPDQRTTPVFLDLDGDGRNEIVFGGSTFDLSGFRFAVTAIGGPSSQQLDRLQVRMLPLPGEHMAVVKRIGQPDTLAVSLSNFTPGSAKLVELGGMGLETIREVDLPGLARVVQVDDIDGDGELEALAFAGQANVRHQPMLLDFADLVVKWQGNEPMFDGAAVQLDTDPALEILLTDALVGRIVDGGTRLPEWSWPNGFGFEVIPGHFEADPSVSGFVALGEVTQVFRSGPYSPLREFAPVGYGATGFDSDRDGIDELFGGSLSPPFNLIRMSSIDGNLDVIAPLGTNMLSLAVDRLTDQGAALGAVKSLDGWSGPRVIDINSGEWVWNSDLNRGPLVQGVFLSGAASAPLQVAVLTRSASSLAPGSSLQIHDANTGALVLSRPEASYGDNIVASRSLLSGDMDGVEGDELVIVDRANSGNWVSVLDGQSFEDRWRVGGPGSPLSENNWTQTAGLMHFDNVPGLDVVLAMGVPNSWNIEIVVLSGTNGAVVWRSGAISRDFTTTDVGMALGDVDGQPGEEIVVATGSEVIAIDASTRLLRWSVPAGPGESFIGVASWGSGERCRIGVKLQSETLRALDCNDRTLRESIALPVGVQEVMPLDSEGLVLGAAAGDSYWVSVNGTPFTEALPDVGPLATVNGPSALLDADTVADFLMGSTTRMQRIRIDADVLFTNGFEGGGS